MNATIRPALVGQLHGPASSTGEEMVAAMDAVGVDGAIIVAGAADLDPDIRVGRKRQQLRQIGPRFGR